MENKEVKTEEATHVKLDSQSDRKNHKSAPLSAAISEENTEMVKTSSHDKKPEAYSVIHIKQRNDDSSDSSDWEGHKKE